MFFIPLFFIGFFILCTVIFILFYMMSTIFLKKNIEVTKPKKFAYFIMRNSCEFAFFFIRHKLKIIGKEKVPKGPVCFVYNHLAMFDPILIMIYLRKKNLICITKQENINIFVGGNYMIHAGYVPINRDDDFQTAKGIIKCINYAKKNYSIAVAPEGTRNKTDDILLPFHPGCFKIPLKAQIPIVIVGFKGNEKIYSSFFKFKKVHLTMEILDVLEYNDFKDKNTFEISDLVREKMLQFLTKSNDEISELKN